MVAKVACPNGECRSIYHVAEENLGKPATCKKCGHTFTLKISLDETSAIVGDGAEAKPVPVQSLRPQVGGATVAPVAKSSLAGPPSKIAHYVLQRRLGSGAMGDVWLARDADLERDVAIKTLRNEFAKDPEYLERFLREARSAAQLHHTHTVTIYQVGAECETAYIAMEMVDGGSLDLVSKERGPMPWREATQVIRDAASGLAAAHELGLIHRDLKPANLMRTSKGVTKVADFGLARAGARDTQLTQQGTLLGTPAFMAPELWIGRPADARSDLYALTLTYYFLLTGQLPFDAEQIIQVGYQHRHEPLPDPRRLAPDIPEQVLQILLRGALKDPEQRYQTSAELIADLDSILSGAVPSSSPLAGLKGTVSFAAPLEQTQPKTLLQPSPAGPRGPRRRTPFRVVAAAAGAAALLFGVVFYVKTNHGTLKIELSDPQAKVQVTVDGEKVDIAGLKDPLSIQVGEHDLRVSGNGFETVSTSFSVTRGEDKTLTVELVSKSQVAPPAMPAGSRPVAVASAAAIPPIVLPATKPNTVAAAQATPASPLPAPAASTAAQMTPIASVTPQNPATSTPPAPPSAEAPFDAITARRHQDAWAKHLQIPVELTNWAGVKFVLIPPSRFLMGSPPTEVGRDEAIRDPFAMRGDKGRSMPLPQGDQELQHEAVVAQPYYLSVTELTQEQWERVMSTDRLGVRPGESPDHPIGVVGHRVEEFVKTLNRFEAGAGRTYRLPTEAEWENACRAGTNTPYHAGSTPSQINDFEWSQDNCTEPQPVGQKNPNPWGLFDMAGNLREWCADDYGLYSNNPPKFTSLSVGDVPHVVRGGSYKTRALQCRSACRYRSDTRTLYLEGFGMRLVMDVVPRNGAENSLTAGRTPASTPTSGYSSSSTNAVVATPAIPIPGKSLKYLGFCVFDEPQAVAKIAPFSNIVFDRGWLANDDIHVREARKLRLPVVLCFHRKERPGVEAKLAAFLAKNKDVVIGIQFTTPYTGRGDDYSVTEVAAFGDYVHRTFPGIQYWVAFTEKPAGQVDQTPIPAQVDAISVVYYYCHSPEIFRASVDGTMPGWLAKAAGRPVLLHWVTKPSGNPTPSVLKCEPGTLKACEELAKKHGLSGLVIDQFGLRRDGFSPGIETDSAALQEVIEIARSQGIDGSASKVAASSPSTETTSGISPSALALKPEEIAPGVIGESKVFETDFASEVPEFPVLNGAPAAKYESGHYIARHEKQGTGIGGLELTSIGDFACELRAKFTSSTPSTAYWGILVGSNRNSFTLSPARIISFKESRSKLPGDFSKTGDDYTTMLLVVRNQAVTLYLDGRQVAGPSNLLTPIEAHEKISPFCGGSGCEVHFDRFILWKLQSQTPLPEAAGKTSSGSPEPLRVYVNSLNTQMVFIDPPKMPNKGKFVMGRTPLELQLYPDEQSQWNPPLAPQHSVTLTRRFLIATTEVTQGEWTAVMGTKPWLGKDDVADDPKRPANYLSKSEALDYCARLSARENVTYRLPTEAEWEYCCRAGTTTVFFFGNDERQIVQFAWSRRDPGGPTGWGPLPQPVGTKQPNAWGLYDMVSNVGEWVQDWAVDLSADAAVDPIGPPAGTRTIVRGGNNNYIGCAGYSSGSRNASSASRITTEIGFRVVCDVDAKIITKFKALSN